MAPSTSVNGMVQDMLRTTGGPANRSLEDILQSVSAGNGRPTPADLTEIVVALTQSVARLAAEVETRARVQLAGGPWGPEL